MAREAAGANFWRQGPQSDLGDHDVAGVDPFARFPNGLGASVVGHIREMGASRQLTPLVFSRGGSDPSIWFR
jgi:hypothetical protein